MTHRRFSQASSVIEPILALSAEHGDARAVIFIDNDETEHVVTYRELHRRAADWAGFLRRRGVEKGDAVVLAQGHSLDLVFSFWGALYLGAVPSVFPYKGPLSSAAAFAGRLGEGISAAGAKAVFVAPELEEPLRALVPDGDRKVFSDRPGELSPGEEPPLETGGYTSGEEIAYLQFTSGTTGLQKGVLLSHRAILGFIWAADRAMLVDENDVYLDWLPLYHDFGMFCGFVLPLLTGRPTVLISPFKWLRKPEIFFQAVHRHRCSISFLPNSGHTHMARFIRPEKMAGLDISPMRIIINGSEPVLYETQELFLKHFGPLGFRETALNCGYGMAENSLALTFGPVGRRSTVDWVDARILQSTGKAVPSQPEAVGSKALVSAGVPLEGMRMEIRDDEGRDLEERHAGEIVIDSPSLFSGYLNRPDLTAEVMDGRWYRTGDLGYIAGGELFICGRKKDLIIVGGNNIYPEDLEHTAGSVPGLTPDRVVAFGVPDETTGTERAIVICELRGKEGEEEKREMERSVRQRILEHLEVTLGEVLIAEKGWVERTNNGKLSRPANRAKYMNLRGTQ